MSSDRDLQQMSEAVVKDVTTAFRLPYYTNPVTNTETVPETRQKEAPAMGLTLLTDPDPARVIRFYGEAPLTPGDQPTIGQVHVERDITFIYISDGYKDSFLILVHSGKVVQNLALEQQILSGPEVLALIQKILPD